jgi:hypothetical protein
MELQVEEFFDLFISYNEMFLVVIILTYVLAVIALFMVYSKRDYSNRFISLTLAFLWLWVGIIFGILVFGPVPVVMAGIEIPGAWYLFGSIFAIHGIILLYFGVLKDTVSYNWKPDSRHYIGLILILYGLVLYPLVGILTNRVIPEYPIFGIAPCPVTAFTIGLLLMSEVRPSFLLWIIPIFWGFMGTAPVIFYEVYADIGTVIAALIALYHYIKWPDAI